MKKKFKSKQENTADKLDLTIIPPAALEAAASVLQHGAKKYSRDNWLRVENAPHEYYKALRRHQLDLEYGILTDCDSGFPTTWMILANAVILASLPQHGIADWIHAAGED